MRIVRYWQEGLWQTIYNQQPLSQTLLTKALTYSQAEILSGDLQTSAVADKSMAVWVAPLIFYKATPTPEYWIPLWLPATLTNNQLTLRSDNVLPWVPAGQFDAAEIGPFEGERAAVDDWLRYECLNEENQLIWESWSECVNACIEALDIFSEKPWQETLLARGFEIMSESMIWPESELLGEALPEEALSPLLKQFAEIDEIEKSQLLEALSLQPILRNLCGSAEKTLTHSVYQTALKILSLTDEPLITLRTPIGCNKVSCLATLIASKVVQQTIHQQTLPKITYLTTQENEIAALLAYFNTAYPTATLAQCQQTFADYQQGLAICQQLQGEQSNEADLDDLQQEDESLEKTLQGYFAKQEQLQPKSRLARFLNRFRKNKQHAAELMSLGEKIRRCKTKRAKIHRTIVKVVELLNIHRQAQKDWQTWIQQSGMSMVSIEDIQRCYSEKLFRMVMGYWQCQTADWLQINPHADLAMDYVFIDHAERYTPQQIAPYLSQAKQAFFLGDNQEHESVPSISQLAEERALSKHLLDDEDTIEQMHYKGMMLSTGNAFTVALANSRAQLVSLPIDKIYHPDISRFLGEEPAHELLIEQELFSSLDGLRFVEIEGVTEKRNQEFVNEHEAQTVVQWILSGPLRSRQQLIQIFTPFKAQQHYLNQQLQAAGLACAVYDLANLPNQVSDYVIFSPVYTAGCRRPFMFDRGEQHFYRMIARARCGFWIIGDKRIFDSKMHSPSGKLAKTLFAKTTVVAQQEMIC